jgi:endo-1,4-beta-xylanase
VPGLWQNARAVKRLGILLALAFFSLDCRPRKEPTAPPLPPVASAAPASSSPQAGTLRAAATKHGRKVGVALATWFFGDQQYQELAAREYDSLTAENEMKWYATEPEPGRFTFDGGDRLVLFAEANGMRVRGHALVWHNQLAPWVKLLAGKELHAAMLRHVTETTKHYRGRIAQWDVVNESVDDAGKLRADSPFTALGRAYVADAFRAAHAADPKAELYYNDYDVEDHASPKSQGAYELVKWLKESGVPIHGMGFQMHVDPRRWPTKERMQETFERYAALGLSIELTEIDVPLGELPGTPAEKLAAQKTLTDGVVSACLAVKACTGMTFWGLTDKQSWLSTAEWAPLRGKGPHRPLPFDENYQPKPMHAGILEALGR